MEIILEFLRKLIIESADAKCEIERPTRDMPLLGAV
jgi:hypothetical protein